MYQNHKLGSSRA